MMLKANSPNAMGNWITSIQLTINNLVSIFYLRCSIFSKSTKTYLVQISLARMAVRNQGVEAMENIIYMYV